MPVKEAREKLAAYRRQLKRKADAEYEAVAKGYEELEKGRALIDVGAAIREAPRDEKGRPMIAIARSDRREVEYRQNWRDEIFCAHSAGYSMSMEQDNPTLVRMFGHQVSMPNGGWPQGYAMVPMVPAEALEKAGNPDLSKCFTLWEVEKWRDRSRTMPDRDPYLLRHVGGALYAVLAAWDLTDLERAIMSARRAR